VNNEKSFPALLIDINGTTGVGEEARVIDYCAMYYNVLEQEVETFMCNSFQAHCGQSYLSYEST